VSCNGDLNVFDSVDLFKFGEEGEYNVPEGTDLPSGSTFETMAYARLTASYHLQIDFGYDSWIGIPTDVIEVKAELGGEFVAGAGYKLDLQPLTQEWPRKKIWPAEGESGGLGSVTVYIGPVPLDLSFTGMLSYKVKLEMEGGSIQSNAEVTVEKRASVGLHYEKGSGMRPILDNAPLQHTFTPPTIDTSSLVEQGLRAAITLTVIPEVTMTLQGILPVTLALLPAVRVEGALAPQTLQVSAGVSVALGAEAALQKLSFGFLDQYCNNNPACVSVATLGGILPYKREFTILEPVCFVGVCNAPAPDTPLVSSGPSPPQATGQGTGGTSSTGNAGGTGGTRGTRGTGGTDSTGGTGDTGGTSGTGGTTPVATSEAGEMTGDVGNENCGKLAQIVGQLLFIV
jgi:hypothetical protein